MPDARGEYTYPYPRPLVTVDAVVFRGAGGAREVLLIRRKNEPFAGQWALPGGFVDMDEDLPDAAARELAEETGLRGVALTQFHAFGKPGRDPRGRNICIAYVGAAPLDAEARGGDDASEARWFPLKELPRLAFDHDDIIARAVAYSSSVS